MRFNQAVAAFACVLAVSLPRFAVEAAPHAGGHGGGFHGSFGGFHGGGLGGFHGAHFGDHHGGFWHGHRHGGWWWGGVLGLAALPHFYDPYFYDYDYPDYAAYDYVGRNIGTTARILPAFTPTFNNAAPLGSWFRPSDYEGRRATRCPTGDAWHTAKIRHQCRFA